MTAIYNATSLAMKVGITSLNATFSTHCKFAHFLRAIAAITAVIIKQFVWVFGLPYSSRVSALGLEMQPATVSPTCLAAFHTSFINLIISMSHYLFLLLIFTPYKRVNI